MPVVELMEPTDDVVQKHNYNSNVGGNLNLQVTTSLSPGMAWGVFGAILNDTVDVSQIESQIVPDISALPSVVAVVGDQLYGQGPDSVLAINHECRLYVTVESGGSVAGSGTDEFGRVVRSALDYKVNPNKKWLLMMLHVPAVLTDTSITQIENEIDTVTGITKSKHNTDGAVPDRQTGDGPLSMQGHMRIEDTTIALEEGPG